MSKTKTKKTTEEVAKVTESPSENLSVQRYNAFLKHLEDQYLWWGHIAENGSVPENQPLSPREKQRAENSSKRPLKKIIMSAEEYLGGIPKKYESYAKLENELFPDLFRDVFDNDVASLYEAIASSKVAGLYSNLMTAALQQKEQEKKRKLALSAADPTQAKPLNKSDLAGYMVDIVTKYLLGAKEDKDKKEDSKKKPTKDTTKVNDKLVVKKSLKNPEPTALKKTPRKQKGKKNENNE